MNLKMTEKQLGEESRMCVTDCTGAQGKTKSQGSKWRWRELDQNSEEDTHKHTHTHRIP